MHHLHHTKRAHVVAGALLALASLTPLPAVAQTAPAPATRTIPLFTWDDAVLGGVLIGGTLLLRSTDQRWAQRLQNPASQSNRFLQDVATGFRTVAEPGSLIIGGSMYAIGRLSKQRDMADLGLHGTEAIVLGSAVAGVLKTAFGRARPFVHPPTDSTGFNPNDWQFGRGLKGGDQYRSFPSGHSVAAFAAAAAVTNEAGRWWPSYQWLVGSAMFGGATMVGISRMYNNKHWASDVMLGAAIGIFAGNKVVRYHHRTNPGNRFDKWLLAGSLSPRRGGGFAFSWTALPGLSMGPANR